MLAEWRPRSEHLSKTAEQLSMTVQHPPLGHPVISPAAIEKLIETGAHCHARARASTSVPHARHLGEGSEDFAVLDYVYS